MSDEAEQEYIPPKEMERMRREIQRRRDEKKRIEREKTPEMREAVCIH